MTRTRTAIGTSRRLRLVTRRGLCGGDFLWIDISRLQEMGFVTLCMVITNIAIENGNFWWVFPLEKLGFSIAMFNCQRVHSYYDFGPIIQNSHERIKDGKLLWCLVSQFCRSQVVKPPENQCALIWHTTKNQMLKIPQARRLARRPLLKRNTWRWLSSCSQGARTGWWLLVCQTSGERLTTNDGSDNLAIAACFGLIHSSGWLC